MEINYEKRKNTELFQTFKQKKFTFLSNVQNYSPIYKKFFLLNETNYNSVNLNHEWFLKDIKNVNFDFKHLYSCALQNVKTEDIKEKDVFFKMAPLLDPFKYIVGKYDITDTTLFNLPVHDSVPEQKSVHPKIVNENNSAYVDGMFSFLSSTLIHKHNFVHGVDYYGSFLAIKNAFKLNVIDDLEYLCKSEFFNKHKNSLFEIEPYEHFFAKKQLMPIKISSDEVIDDQIETFDDSIFEDIFMPEPRVVELEDESTNILSLNDLVDMNNSEEFIENPLINAASTTLKSITTCSSRSSYTTASEDDEEDKENEDSSGEGDNECSELFDKDKDKSSSSGEEDEEEEESESDMLSNVSDEELYVTIKQFPVQVICMEYCENTFDSLIIREEELSHDEWFSALMQIIMILITYQKVFSFTHNDLHTNNIMYNKTSKKFLYYCYNNKFYRVPTFGRIFKIIDFGRSIYKYNKLTFCSDSFKKDEDAHTQYNFEPYLNEKKPRLEPNYSFDLCRLACSIFDYIVEDLSDIKNLKKCSPIVRLIVEWCLDDNDVNVLYKTNGDERYPDFKLYKMIARCVHNHTPQVQLKRKEFDAFFISKKSVPKDENVMNIDHL
jgi:hypothetical protein